MLLKKVKRMEHAYSSNLKVSFDEAVRKVMNALNQQGFGIVTRIDLNEALHDELNVDFRKYTMIGACNPEFAYRMVSLESHMGLLLPCNIVVQEHENGEVEISASCLLETIDRVTATDQLLEIAQELTRRLRAAVDNLHNNKPECDHTEALPMGYKQPTPQVPMFG